MDIFLITFLGSRPLSMKNDSLDKFLFPNDAMKSALTVFKVNSEEKYSQRIAFLPNKMNTLFINSKQIV